MLDYKKKVVPNVPHAWVENVSPTTSAFYKDLKPLLMLLRAMGTIPYHHAHNGELSFKFLHPVTFYTFILQIIVAFGACMRQKSLLNQMETHNMNFLSKLMDYVALVTYVPCLLIPLTNWPETSKKLTYFNEWLRFQVEFTAVTGKPLELNMGLRVRMAQTAYVVYVLANMILFSWRFQGSDLWWTMPTMVFSILFIVMVLNLWIACCWELERAAYLLGNEMEQQILLFGLERGARLAKFRVLWLRLSGLTRDLGNSMALTVGAHLVIHFALLVMFTYYTIMSIAKGEGFNILHMMVIVTFNFIGTYMACSSAQGATEQVGGAFRDRLERLEFCFWIKHRSAEYELQKFLKTITRHKPVISFSGFTDVNRGLQTSFVSSLVTYMVVLVQFNMGEDLNDGKHNSMVTTKNNEMYGNLKILFYGLKIMGAFPYHFSSEGTMSFKLLHPVTAYSVLIQTFITVTTTLREGFLLRNIGRYAEDLTRPNVVLMSIAMLVYLPSLLVPVTHWPETKKKIQFLNDYTLFETEFFKVTKRTLNFRIKHWIYMAMLGCTVYTITQDMLFYNKFPAGDYWWALPVYIFCSVFLSLVIVLWVGVCASLYLAAKSLAKEMQKEFRECGLWRAAQVAKYRKLWLQLSALIRNLGDSLAFTMGSHMIVMVASPVLCIYYFLLTMSNEHDQYMLRGISLPFYGFLCVFVSCIAAQEAALQVGIQFRDEIESMELQLDSKSLSVEEEIQKFLNAISSHSPVVSLQGFTDVNARLVTSFMSSMMTYMVVLIQFNISQQIPEKCASRNTTL